MVSLQLDRIAGSVINKGGWYYVLGKSGLLWKIPVRTKLLLLQAYYPIPPNQG